MIMLRKLINLVTHRLFITLFILLIQVIFFVLVVLQFRQSILIVYFITQILAMVIILKIISSEMNPGYKIAWIIPVLIIPIFGTLIYLVFSNRYTKKTKARLNSVSEKYSANLCQNEDVIESVDSVAATNQMMYLYNAGGFPVYKHTDVEYLKIGEEYFERLKKELRKAKKYIFLEYFIIEEGYMWDSILEILKEKVKEGVDVRILYDDMGCILTLPNKYYQKLISYGIKCCSFNKFIPIFNSKLNCRDHRKIAVIDGAVGFTGGINLADEYINKKVRFGHWKDNGVMLKGDAVWSLTVMFLTTWNYVNNEKDNYEAYKTNHKKILAKGYVQPYNDSPLDSEAVGETVYFNIINKASNYIYITTPYLVIDNELETALKVAAKSGVDVRIIVPGIPDKKMVNELTKAYYNNLLESGVKIYEYQRGFVHAKTFVADDIYATVGTINLDYRSLYLHFECGIFMYKTSCIKDIKEDFMNTLSECVEIHLSDTKIGLLRKLKRDILRLISPLL